LESSKDTRETLILHVDEGMNEDGENEGLEGVNGESGEHESDSSDLNDDRELKDDVESGDNVTLM
jgi:hypothetical protein